jgi:hypothetical protein
VDRHNGYSAIREQLASRCANQRVTLRVQQARVGGTLYREIFTDGRDMDTSKRILQEFCAGEPVAIMTRDGGPDRRIPAKSAIEIA